MRRRRAIVVFVVGVVSLVLLAGAMPRMIEESLPPAAGVEQASEPSVDRQSMSADALEQLDKLEVKGRAPKTGYSRSEFGSGWATVKGCSTRDIILHRDLLNPVLDDECKVLSGVLHDTYTGETIHFNRAESSKVQIDHVVALSDAWQKGAQQLTLEQRKQLANDPLELIAVSGTANQAKSDSDAATWLPKNKAFRCEYVVRQVAVKQKYMLWVTTGEKEAIRGVLTSC